MRAPSSTLAAAAQTKSRSDRVGSIGGPCGITWGDAETKNKNMGSERYMSLHELGLISHECRTYLLFTCLASFW